MKPKFFIRLNLIVAGICLLALIIILFLVDPFRANWFLIFLFYFVAFFFIFSIVNLLEKIFVIPIWCRALIAFTVVALLFIQKNF